MKRPNGTPVRSVARTNRPAVTNSVVPGSMRWTKASEVIVECALAGRIGALTRARGPLHEGIAQRISKVMGLTEKVVYPKQRKVDADGGAGLAGLGGGYGPIAHADLGGGLLNREIARQACGAQVRPQIL